MGKIFLSILLIGITIAPASLMGADKFVNIYSARKEALILPLLKRFKKETGISYRLVTGKADGLLKRLEIEGSLSPADLFITVDAGRLQRAKQAGVLQPIDNPTLEQRIPTSLRDRENYWFGMSQRARTIIYNTKTVDATNLSPYEELASPKWKGKLCIRSSGSVYNQSLVASLIDNNGSAKTAEWAKGIVSNFARPAKGNDRAQILAVAAGEADYAVANTYYIALMLSGKKGPEQQAAAKKVKPFFPNQMDRGTHMNISGGGILKYAPNKKNAIKLLEFLVTPEAQEHIVNNTFEYPIIDGVQANKLIGQFGTNFKQDLKTKVSAYGKRQAAALKIMTKAGWN